MSRKSIVDPRRDERREDRMRPSRFLGYDRDSLGLYALSREMFDVAEAEFRRAAYLNPYEPRFKQHLAWCLHKQQRDGEALPWITEALELRPADKDSEYIAEVIRQRLGSAAAPGGTGAGRDADGTA